MVDLDHSVNSLTELVKRKFTEVRFYSGVKELDKNKTFRINNVKHKSKIRLKYDKEI
jgi:hypothetical protein